MGGFAGETMYELNQSFKAAKDIRSTSVTFFLVTPYPGTKLWETAKEFDAMPISEDHSMDGVDGIDSMIELFLRRSKKGIINSN